MFGPACKLLIHVDEHGKMCDRPNLTYSSNAEVKAAIAFSRGAIETLAKLPNVEVVATYIEQPDFIAAESSDVCRFPVNLPCLNIDQLMQSIPELRYPPEVETLPRDLWRLWVTLRFRLSNQLTIVGLGGLHVRGTDPDLEDLLNQLRENLGRLEILIGRLKVESLLQSETDIKNEMTTELRKCILLCSSELDYPAPNPNAAQLLIGVKDSDQDPRWVRQVSDLVLYNKLVTCSLNKLLTMKDPNISTYAAGRARLTYCLRGSEVDLLAQTPLEAVTGELIFNDISFLIQPTDLEAGRIFLGDDTTAYDFTNVKLDMMYYADKRIGKPSHPLADIFFRTQENELVLIDVTGGNQDKVKEKRLRLVNWINEEQPKVKGLKLIGIVLAPCVEVAKIDPNNVSTNIPLPSTDVHHQVLVVKGVEARNLMGGLGQVFRRF